MSMTHAGKRWRRIFQSKGTEFAEGQRQVQGEACGELKEAHGDGWGRGLGRTCTGVAEDERWEDGIERVERTARRHLSSCTLGWASTCN